MSYEIRQTGGGASSIIEIVLLLALLSFFLMVVAVLYIVRCFVKYHKEHKSLWIALAVCLVLAAIGGLLAWLVNGAFLALVYVGVAVLLITCFVVDLKNRDLLQPEKTNLVERVLHSSWWANENTPLETEREQLAA